MRLLQRKLLIIVLGFCLLALFVGYGIIQPRSSPGHVVFHTGYLLPPTRPVFLRFYHWSLRKFEGGYLPSLIATGERVQLRVLVDSASIEVFAAGGATSLTALVFPSGKRALEFFGNEGCEILSFDAWTLGTDAEPGPAATEDRQPEGSSHYGEF